MSAPTRPTTPVVPGARIRVRKSGTTWQVTAPRLATVRELAIASLGAPAVRLLELEVAAWKPPVAGWFGRPGIAGLTRMECEATATGARILMESATPVDPGLLLSAAVRCLQPMPSGDTSGLLTAVPGLGVKATCLAGALHDVLLPGEVRDKHVRRADDLVSPRAAADVDEVANVACERAFTIDDSGWWRNGTSLPVLIDPFVHRPLGRRTTEATSVAQASVDGEDLVVHVDGTPVRLTADLTAAQARALRAIGAIECAGAVPHRLAVQLNACGIVVRAPGHPWPATDDFLQWQALSVAERRHALRAHSPAAAFDSWPSVSIVLATHRNDHLDHAFAQLARLRYPRLEVVIGAHGDSIDLDGARQRAAMLPFTSRVLPVSSDRNLGQVLQACSDAADGTVVTKMDDDDYYAPEHVWDLVLARMYSGAQVVGKALDWVHLAALDTTVLRPVYGAERYADFVAGGTMLISKADLLGVGGWRPVPKSVDRALLDRVLADGGLVYRTHGLGYVYERRAGGHTAAVADEHFLTKTTAQYPGLLAHPELGTGGPA